MKEQGAVELSAWVEARHQDTHNIETVGCVLFITKMPASTLVQQG